ncbi:MAG: hypothetical protein KatS3mg082_0191 [Nitrospiraceae bacterium]|nr:MAG: hypothetical protein KatS3mg082_0191 [Nitrospiraceae bacterium]
MEGGYLGPATEVQGPVGQGLVKQREEAFSAVVVMLPRIFPVEDHGDQCTIGWHVLDDRPKTAQDVFHRRLRGGLVIDKSERVGEFTVAEDDREFFSRLSDQIRMVERGASIPRAVLHFQRPGQDAFIGREPAESGCVCQRKHFRTDGTFRRPESCRWPAERRGVKGDGLADLGLRVFLGLETRGQGKIGVAHVGQCPCQ